MAKFAEDDRIEQLNAQKRRMKQLEHRREIERLLEERRAAYDRERATAAHEAAEADARERARLQVVAEERERILKAHAAVLGLDDLPKGVLQSMEDLSIFSKEGGCARDVAPAGLVERVTCHGYVRIPLRPRRSSRTERA